MTKKLNRVQQGPKVGIAIVAWNNESIIGTCLESVASQTYNNIKTIVLDNDSYDNTREIIKSDYPWVKLVESDENTGFARGNNLIISQFVDEGIDYIVLLNSDATLESNWVSQLIEFAQRHEKLASIQGLTLDFYDHETVDSTHIYVNRSGQAIQSGHRLPKSSVSGGPKQVFGVNAAACMISTKFLQAQPFEYVFDEDFFMYLEDVDFAARAFVAGWGNYLLPAATAYHMGSASSGKNPGFSVNMVNRNRLPLLIKNFPVTVLFRILPRMIKADLVELYHIAKGKNYQIVYKYITGRLKGALICPLYLTKRHKLSRYRELSAKQIWATLGDGVVTEEVT